MELRRELKSVGFQVQQSSPPSTNIIITTNNDSTSASEHSARRRARGSAKRELTSHSKPEGGSYSQILTPTLQRRKLRFKEKSFIQDRNAAPVSLAAIHPHHFLPSPTAPGPRLTWPAGPAPTRAARPPLRAEPTVRLPPLLARRSIPKAPLPPPEARLTRPRPL